MGKQAVVLIHGIGEQRPMETLLSFIDAAWANDQNLGIPKKKDPNTGAARGQKHTNVYWSKPDRRSRSFELRTLTTETGKNQRRTDFYEYYWANLIVDTKWEQLRAWIFSLMWRWPQKVPGAVRPVWVILWVIALGAAAIWVWWLRPGDGEATWLGAIAVALATAVIGSLGTGFLVRYLGDVARYVRPKPENVARRQEIRENGVRLIESLLGFKEDGTLGKSAYDRIVVVGHSLGTIIAYDILTHAFARVNSITSQTAARPAAQNARVELEAMIRAGLDKPEKWDLGAFQQAQAAAAAELKKSGNPWIVSDFVTIGSPLTHAEFLIVNDRDQLSSAKEQRILPSCPPTLEYDGATRLRHFTYQPPSLKGGPIKGAGGPRVPHHAALFAYTRWTNIHSPHRFVLFGDLISGPVADAFGLEADGKLLPGIRDVQVMPAPGGRGPWRFTHTKYWREGADPHTIEALRGALRLGEKPVA